MFIRFIGKEVDPLSNVEKGIFTLAYDLKNGDLLRKDEVIFLDELFAWFKQHLPIPTAFGSPIDANDNTSRGICWFRSSSNGVLAKVWELKFFIEDQGILIDVLKAESVGYWLYSDEYQVVAEPRRPSYKKLKRH